LNIRSIVLFLVSHACAVAIGFGAGIYALPILIAPPSPSEAAIVSAASDANYSAAFRRDLIDSDTFHWGEGRVSISADSVSFVGTLAPGPDYKLYFSPEFVETEADFNRLKSQMVRLGDVKTFDSFIVKVPTSIDPSVYTSLIVWCETFGEFITAAQYK